MNFATTKERILQFLDCKGIKQSEFLFKTGIKRGFLDGDKLKGAVNDTFIAKIIASYPEINLEWLITGEGEMQKNAQVNAQVNAQLSQKKSENTPHIYKESAGTLHRLNEPTIKRLNVPSSERLNDTNIIKIPMVDVAAAAGHGAINSDYFETTGQLMLPAAMFGRDGVRYCVSVRGLSMSPTLQDNDHLIIRQLTPAEWHNMPDEHIYLIVDNDGQAYVKRVKNRFIKGFVVLMSDSIDKASYPNFNLQASDIHNIFYAEWHFSAKMQNLNETYYDRLKLLEDTVADLAEAVKRLNKD